MRIMNRAVSPGILTEDQKKKFVIDNTAAQSWRLHQNISELARQT